MPCLVLRDATEWVEAVAGSGGRMVLVGLDAGRARIELDRLAPIDGAVRLAEARARDVDVPAVSAGTVISTVLEAGRAIGGSPGR